MAVALERERLFGVSAVLSRIPEWWESRAAAAGLPPEWRRWDLAIAEPPIPFEPSVSRLLDETSFEIGDAYIEALDPSSRLIHGRHYTPYALAEQLWQEVLAVSGGDGPVVDPAAGAGGLLVPALRHFVINSSDPGMALRKVRELFGGTDLDPIGVWLGNAFLAAELLPLWTRLPPEQRTLLPQLLRVGDGLAVPQHSAQTIVMNPPYGRVRLSPAARERWAPTLFGHANRYALFLQAAVERVRTGGVVAALIPTSFLGGAYFKRLRAFLASEAPIVRLVFIDTRSGVFAGDVLQETCLALFVKGARSRSVSCARTWVNGSAKIVALPATELPHVEQDRPWLLPRAPHDGRLVERASRLGKRLSDYGWKASTGPLVWNRHKTRIHGVPSADAVPILWAADLDNGTVKRSPARDQQRWITLRPHDGFMRQTEPALFVQRTTAPEQPRRLVVATLDRETLGEWGGAVVVENHVNVLHRTGNSELSPDLLHRLLSTTTFDRLYRCLTGSVAVSAYELEALPMPSSNVIRSWANCEGGALEDHVAEYYGG